MFRRTCPVEDRERIWIEVGLTWLTGEFGEDVLRRDVLLPEDPRLPRPYRDRPEDVRRVVDTLFAHLGVERPAVAVEMAEEDPAERELVTHMGLLTHESYGAAGHYQRAADGRPLITLSADLTADPVALAAVLAHELGHHRLLGEQRIPPGRRDGEPLTDLLTVFFGAGHFNATAAFRFTQDARGWRRRTLGYLTQPMFGYALARYAWLRGETAPPWARLLDTNVRTYLRQGLRYLG